MARSLATTLLVSEVTVSFSHLVYSCHNLCLCSSFLFSFSPSLPHLWHQPCQLGIYSTSSTEYGLGTSPQAPFLYLHLHLVLLELLFRQQPFCNRLLGLSRRQHCCPSSWRSCGPLPQQFFWIRPRIIATGTSPLTFVILKPPPLDSKVVYGFSFFTFSDIFPIA